MQLDAALRSFLLHCRDAALFDLYVLYTTSTAPHTHQYAQLVADFQGYPFIHFVCERGFRRDVLGLLAAQLGLPAWQKRAYRAVLLLGRRFGFLGNWLLGKDLQNHILFLVDDNLFVADFNLSTACQTLVQNPDALGFSLRLGRNTVFSYMLDRPQALPEFTDVAPGILKFDWTRSEHDFAYPLEVSSSIYRITQVLPHLNRLWFSNPNWLESRFTACRSFYQRSHPFLLCFEQSVTFCAPINRVESRYQNRAGLEYSYSTQFLAEQYEIGKRIDIAAYNGFAPVGCHQEVELVFKGQG
jgi:hypothetical protein